MSYEYDLFVSHASADKSRYIEPLVNALESRQLTFWLDSREISWGDSVVGRINDGLRLSQYGLLCLSEKFIERPWPEAELAAVLALQNATGKKRVLPLILDARDAVLERYPLIGGLAYREFSMGAEGIADEISKLIQPSKQSSEEFRVAIESAHSGHLISLSVLRRASIEWLIDKATNNAGLRTEADVGAFDKLRVHWVLIDVKAESEWRKMPTRRRERIVCMINTESGASAIEDQSLRLDEIGVLDGTVFHLYAIPERRDFVFYAR